MNYLKAAISYLNYYQFLIWGKAWWVILAYLLFSLWLYPDNFIVGITAKVIIGSMIYMFLYFHFHE